MAKDKKQTQATPARRPGRGKLTAGESLKRVREFSKRKENLVVAVGAYHAQASCQ